MNKETPSITAKIYTTVKQEAGHDATIERLLETYNELVTNGCFSEYGITGTTDEHTVLCEGSEYTIHGTKNLIVARLYMSEDKITALTEAVIIHPDMDIEKIEVFEDFSSVEQIQVLGGENIVQMSVEQIKRVVILLSIEEIQALGGENIVQMSEEQIQAVRDFLSVEEIQALGGENIIQMSVEQMEAARNSLFVGKIQALGGENIVQMSVEQIEAVANFLSVKHIQALGGENIIQMTPKQIETFGDLEIRDIESMKKGNITEMIEIEMGKGIIPEEVVQGFQ